MSLIPKAAFPQIPALPGVPQLTRSPLFPPPSVPTLGNNAPAGTLWRAGQSGPTWGIFLKSKLVLNPDSIVDFDHRNDWRVSDFPVQAGAFASYNKVANPFEISVKMTKGGTQAQRSAFLNQLDSIAGDLNLYTILTPERSYINVNITRYELSRRGVGGAFWFNDVEVFFRQIRTVAAQYTTTAAAMQNAQNADAQPPTNTGVIQPQPAPMSISASEIPPANPG